MGGEATKLIKDFIFIFTREFGEDLFVCDATVKKRARAAKDQNVNEIVILWVGGKLFRGGSKLPSTQNFFKDGKISSFAHWRIDG